MDRFPWYQPVISTPLPEEVRMGTAAQERVAEFLDQIHEKLWVTIQKHWHEPNVVKIKELLLDDILEIVGNELEKE